MIRPALAIVALAAAATAAVVAQPIPQAESQGPATQAQQAAKGEFPDALYFKPALDLGAEGPRGLEGKPMPKLEVKDWLGDEPDLEKLKGRVIVVDFWATWCGPCMRALPHNVEMVKKHDAKDLLVIGVHDAKSGYDKMMKVAQDKGINYPMAIDVASQSEKAWKVRFWPTYIVIDHKGVVRAAGLQPNGVDTVVEKLIEEKKRAEGAG